MSNPADFMSNPADFMSNPADFMSNPADFMKSGKPYKSTNSTKTLQFYGVHWEGYVSGC